MTKPLLSISEARALMDTICRRIDGKPASSFTIEPSPFHPAATRDWWFEKDDTMDVSRSRSVAYLTAYVEICGDALPMTGLPLSDGYLRPDRKVMRALTQQGMVEIRDGHFHLTPEGRELISDHRTVEPRTVALLPGAEVDGIVFGGRGEGANHRALRLWVLENPPSLFPKLSQVQAETEYLLPSADRIDVLYRTTNLLFALEVKSRDSNEADLARGIYQCVKYQAVLRAITQDETIDVRAALVTERPLTSQLQAEARRLRVPNIVVSIDRRV